MAPRARNTMARSDEGSLSTVSSLLWQERELLELLLFKLTEEQLVLAAGITRWLPHANREVETVLSELRGAEVLCAAEVDLAAHEFGLPAAATLAQLIEVSEEPWTTLLADHRTALSGLVAEVETV